MSTKAFKVALPPLREDERVRLARWADAHSSASAIFEEDGQLWWLCAKERPRDRTAYMRYVRAVLAKLFIEPGRLERRRWLTLTSEDYVRQQASTRRVIDSPVSATQAAEDPEGAREVLLSSPAPCDRQRRCEGARHPSLSALEVIKEKEAMTAN